MVKFWTRLSALAAVAILVALPATAKNTRTVIYGPTLITQDIGSATATVQNPFANSAYLNVSGTGEVGTASLTVLVQNVAATGATTTVCTTTALTGNGTWRVLLGSSQTAAESINQVCTMPLGAVLLFAATIADDAGDGGDGFTVTLEWQPLHDGSH